MLNPFYIYGIIWLSVLGVYTIPWSNLYPEISNELKLYFLITISFSAVIGYLLRRKYNFKNCINCMEIKKINIFFPSLIIVVGHLIQFIYVGKIPLIETIQKTGYLYVDFHGIQILHPLLFTFNSYYCVYLFDKYLETKNKKLIIASILLLIPFLLLVNRAAIMMIIATQTLIYLATIKLTFRKIIKISLGVFLLFYGFGIFGNIRHNSKWYDTSYLNKIGQNKKSIEYLDPFFWSYVYLTSPLANLEKNISEKNVEYDYTTLVRKNLMPVFVDTRFLPVSTKPTRVPKLISPYLNLSTGLSSQYLNGGFLGVYLVFFAYILVNIVITFILPQKSPYYRVTIAILCTIVLFSFFINMYVNTALTFQLVYPIISDKISKRFKRSCG